MEGGGLAEIGPEKAPGLIGVEAREGLREEAAAQIKGECSKGHRGPRAGSRERQGHGLASIEARPQGGGRRGIALPCVGDAVGLAFRIASGRRSYF